jgi:hypothetical protein
MRVLHGLVLCAAIATIGWLWSRESANVPPRAAVTGDAPPAAANGKPTATIPVTDDATVRTAVPSAADDGNAADQPIGRLQPGIDDLETLQLGTLPIVLQGRVTVDGEPRRPRMEIYHQEQGKWRQDANLLLEWVGESDFMFQGSIAAGTQLELHVTSVDLLHVRPIATVAGTRHLAIELSAGGSVEATFLVDAGMRADGLDIWLRPIAETAEQTDASFLRRFLIASETHDNGRLHRRWSPLAPGSYTLWVMPAGSRQPLVTIDAIAIGNGPCRDPRLVDIDLRGRLRQLEIRALGSNGTPIVSHEAFVVVRSRGTAWHGFHLSSGVASLLTADPVDLLVVAPGYRAAFVDAVADSRTIALTAALPVAMQLELSFSLPAKIRCELRLVPRIDLPANAMLKLDDGRGLMLRDFFGDDVVLDGSGRGLWNARFTEPHVAMLVLRRPDSSMTAKALLPNDVVPSTVEVVVRAGEQRWQELLESLRR